MREQKMSRGQEEGKKRDSAKGHTREFKRTRREGKRGWGMHADR